MSVDFSKEPQHATCKVCLSLAAEGRLEELKREQYVQPPSDNNRGEPMYTPMQKAFAAHPLIHTNPVKAAIEVGYSESTAKAKAHAMREQLSSLIIELSELAKKKTAISKARVQTELASMGFANILDYFHVDEETGAMRPKQLNELTREQAAAIQEIKVVEFEGKMVVGHLKLADKRANLVELGKTLGMFNKITIEDKREQTEELKNIPTEALEQAEKLLITAASQAKEARNKDVVEGEFKEIPPPGAVESEDPQ